jgi:hypothetical protein
VPRERQFEPPVTIDFAMLLGFSLQKNGCRPVFWIQPLGEEVPGESTRESAGTS